MELDHVDPIICKVCEYEIKDYQQECFTCGCGAVYCPNCKTQISKEQCKEACVY